MSFTLPQLDVVDAPQLLDELIRRIPKFSQRWTNYNESDPGITLLEMLTWVVEASAYQANAVPFEAYRNMLRLVLGLAFSNDTTRPYAANAAQGKDPDYFQLQKSLAQVERGQLRDFDTLREEVCTFRLSPFLAVTVKDLETLAGEANQYIDFLNAQPDATPIDLRVARAFVVCRDDAIELYIRANRGDASAIYSNASIAKSRSLTVISQLQEGSALGGMQHEPALLKAVWEYVTPRALLGSPISVYWVPETQVGVSCTVRCLPRERLDAVIEAATDALTQALQSLADDVSGFSWRYGDAPVKARMLAALSKVSGIDIVEELTLSVLAENTGAGVGPELFNDAPIGVPIAGRVEITALEANV